MSGSVTEKVAPFPAPALSAWIDPAVLLDEMAHDRQAEAEAAVQACVGGVGLGKAIEDVGQEPRSIPAPVSLTLRRAHPFTFSRLTRDVAAVGAELDRVGQQVRDHLLQARGITRDRADGLVEHDVELERLALDAGR